MIFGQLILRKMRRQISRLKCTEIDFSWGSVPDPAGGAYSAPSHPLAGINGNKKI